MIASSLKSKTTCFITKTFLIFLIANYLLSNPISIETISPKVNNFDNNFDDHLINQISGSINQELLYSGIKSPLNIIESAILSDSSLYTIGNSSISNNKPENTSFFVDEVHDWNIYQIDSQIHDIIDERDWIINGDFGSSDEYYQPEISYDTYESAHPYSNNSLDYPDNFHAVNSSIERYGSNYMRIHFDIIQIETDYDYLRLWDDKDNELDAFTGAFSDFWTPWYETSKINITIDSDSSVSYYGYYIDRIESYHWPLFEVSSNNWTYFSANPENPSLFDSGFEEKVNRSAAWVSWEGDLDSGFYNYDGQNVSAFIQNISIPRGEVVDAWISIDFCAENAISTNDIYIFFDINGHHAYTRGLRTINDLGLDQWHSSGLINLAIWENSSSVFDGNCHDQIYNISFGIKTDSSAGYSGYNDAELQKIYFDDIKFILQTKANSSQSDVNLTFDGNTLLQNDTQWGESLYSALDIWEVDPMQIEMNSSSPKLSYTLESTLYGEHLDYTKATENGDNGNSLYIEKDGTVNWDFYHLVYVPPKYENFTYCIEKPESWVTTLVEDPTGIPINYDNGLSGNLNISINSSFAFYPGWWHFHAQSPNMIKSSETYLWNDTKWIGFNEISENNLYYDLDEEISIKTEIDVNNQESSDAILSVYHPNDTIWFEETIHPDILGNIQFSNFTAGKYNSTGGIYTYKIVWTNETSAGAINGTFEIRRSFVVSFEYPRNLNLGGTLNESYGSIIPIRIMLNDSKNNAVISGAEVCYNWSTENKLLNEVASGIYDSSIDTLDLDSAGEYFIEFNISIIGYYDIEFNISLILTKETDFQMVSAESIVDFADNFTLKVRYSDVLNDEGISSGEINLNISSTDYIVLQGAIDGEYDIKVTTIGFPEVGLYDLEINASKSNFETKTIISRIQILPRTVNFNLSINQTSCIDAWEYTCTKNKILNISIIVIGNLDNALIGGGTMRITDTDGFNQLFSSISNHYSIELNTNELDYGIHYLSLIFNRSDCRTTSSLLKLIIEPLSTNVSFYETDPTIIKDRGDEFDATIYIFDSESGLPLIDAQVSYSWIFGTGILTNLGDGYYFFSTNAPTQEGSYIIDITINPGDDYSTSTKQITVISQKPEFNIRNLWWILIPIGCIIAALISIIIKQNVVNPKKEREFELLKLKTQIFDDVTNIRALMIIQKESGLLMYKHIISGLDEGNEQLFTGFLQAIMLLSNKITPVKEKIETEQDEFDQIGNSIEFTHENFNILVMDNINVRIALILERRASEELKRMVSHFSREFESIFSSWLTDWHGDISIFDETAPGIIEQIFNLSLLQDFTLSNSQQLSLLTRKLVSPNTISDKVYKVVIALYEERKFFKLKTIISLLNPEDQIAGKDSLLKFMKHKLIISIGSDEVKEQVISDKIDLIDK